MPLPVGARTVFRISGPWLKRKTGANPMPRLERLPPGIRAPFAKKNLEGKPSDAAQAVPYSRNERANVTPSHLPKSYEKASSVDLDSPPNVCPSYPGVGRQVSIAISPSTSLLRKPHANPRPKETSITLRRTPTRCTPSLFQPHAHLGNLPTRFVDPCAFRPSPSSIRHSPFAIRHSPFGIRHSDPLTARVHKKRRQAQ
jgi:hypothetical protein